MTQLLDTITCSSVVTRETVHIILTLVALLDLEVKLADVLNAYVMTLICEKIWTVLGTDFAEDAHKLALIV